MSRSLDLSAADLVLRTGEAVTAVGTAEHVDPHAARFWVRPAWRNPAIRRLRGGEVMVTGQSAADLPIDQQVRITGLWSRGSVRFTGVDDSDAALTMPWPEVPGRGDEDRGDDESLARLSATSAAAGALALSSGGGSAGLRVQVLHVSDELAAWHGSAHDAVRLLPSIVPVRVLHAHQRRDDLPGSPPGWDWSSGD